MILWKLVTKCPRKPMEDLWKLFSIHFYKSSRGLRGHLITNFPNAMVLVCNTMIDEEILVLFRILLGIWSFLKHVSEN